MKRMPSRSTCLAAIALSGVVGCGDTERASRQPMETPGERLPLLDLASGSCLREALRRDADKERQQLTDGAREKTTPISRPRG